PELAVAQGAGRATALLEGGECRSEAGNLARLIVGARPERPDLALVGQPAANALARLLILPCALASFLVPASPLLSRRSGPPRRRVQAVAAAEPALESVDQCRLLARLCSQGIEFTAGGRLRLHGDALCERRAGQALDLHRLLGGDGGGFLKRLFVAPAPGGQ